MSKEIQSYEKKLLKSLNIRANLILKLENIFKENKIPFNMEVLDTLSDDVLLDLIDVFEKK